ncbi:MAG: acyl-CoA thioesterase [Prevotella sp.]
MRASKVFDIRFSEVDSMSVVWHGSYPLYFEDARETFGTKYGLEYMTMVANGFYAPLVELSFRYIRPLLYEHRYRIDIIYKPTKAAKIVFDYEIHSVDDDELMATGHSVQAFIDLDRKLMLYSPDYYVKWQEKWGVFNED